MNILAAQNPTLAFFLLQITRNHQMDSSASPADDHAKILDYWIRRRHGFSESEWTDFYRLTIPILMATRLPPEYADGTKRRELVDIFFAEKIFLNAGVSKAGPLENVHALHTYLKRFALDIQRRSPPSTAPEDIPHGNAPPVSYTQMLVEAGIDLDGAAQSAGLFLNELDSGDFAYLRYNTCVDEDEKEPISRIAARLAIGTSFHFKAKRLGITRSNGETYVGYEKTKIGRWLLSVGAKLNEEWQEELAVLLTLLCLQVLERGDGTA
jgi:hypothetical protein